MQVLTKNPLASPSVLGVNAGAVLFIVMAITVLGSGLALGTLIWIAFAGAAVTAVLVMLLGSAVYGTSKHHIAALLPWVAVLLPAAWGVTENGGNRRIRRNRRNRREPRGTG